MNDMKNGKENEKTSMDNLFFTRRNTVENRANNLFDSGLLLLWQIELLKPARWPLQVPTRRKEKQ